MRIVAKQLKNKSWWAGRPSTNEGFHTRRIVVSFRSFTAVVAALSVAVLVHAGEKGKTQPTVKPAQGSIVGSLACSKCDFKATEKCQTALQLDGHRFVLVSGKAGQDLFKARCSGKLVRVSGAVTIKNGQLTITGAKSAEVRNQVTLAGKLVCSKCDFKIGKCAAALKAGNVRVLLDGDAAKALFQARCSGKPKVATGVLTKIDGNTVYLKVSRVDDPKPVWQPMLTKSFKADTRGLRVNGLVVDRNVGCVFLSVEGRGVYCSAFGANRFHPNNKTWEQVCKLRTRESKHKFVLTDGGIKESRDGGATWSQPIPPPRGFVMTAQTWVAYDAKHDNLYLMKAGSELYKLARGN